MSRVRNYELKIRKQRQESNLTNGDLIEDDNQSSMIGGKL